MARQIEELKTFRSSVEDDHQIEPRINQLTIELSHAKEALSGENLISIVII